MELSIEKVNPIPVYRQIADIIKSRIVSGEWNDGSKLPPEPELAEKFGTSRLTLRKSLKILEGQRLIIQKKGCGTFITFSPIKKFRVAVTIDIQQYDYYSLSVFAGLVKTLQMDLGNEVVLLDQKNKLPMLQKFHDSGCDGLISVAPSMAMIEELCKSEFDDVPMVFLHASGGILEEKKKVCVDISKNSISIAMDRLVELGHRRIAFFTPDPYNANFKSRIEEYHDAVKKYGLDSDERLFYMIVNVPLWFDAARDKAKELCSSLTDRPTAIVCTGRTFAYGAWQGVMESGLRIPDDISIIGFDCEITSNPHLSTIVQPIYEMARKAGELMLSTLDGRGPCNNVFFNAFLDERESISSVAEKI